MLNFHLKNQLIVAGIALIHSGVRLQAGAILLLEIAKVHLKLTFVQI